MSSTTVETFWSPQPPFFYFFLSFFLHYFFFSIWYFCLLCSFIVYSPPFWLWVILQIYHFFSFHLYYWYQFKNTRWVQANSCLCICSSHSIVKNQMKKKTMVTWQKSLLRLDNVCVCTLERRRDGNRERADAARKSFILWVVPPLHPVKKTKNRVKERNKEGTYFPLSSV